MELRASQASPAVFALLQTRSEVTDRHLYMELVVLFHFIPNFQAVHGGKAPVGAVSAWDTVVPCQEEHLAVLAAPEWCPWHSGFPTFSPFFLWPQASTSAPPAQPLLISHWFLCWQGNSFLELEWDTWEMLLQTCKKLPKRSWRRHQ